MLAKVCISQEALARIVPFYQRCARYDFRNIPLQDQTGMYICVFRKYDIALLKLGRGRTAISYLLLVDSLWLRGQQHMFG